MKGNKEGKGDGSNHRGGGGGAGGGSSSGANGLETGALFPRLHVKETKRVGPRAPPRNKMALYEQFSFPSNRFVSPTVPLPTSARSGAAGGSTLPYSPHVLPTGEKMYEQFTFSSHRMAPPSGSLPSSGMPSNSSSTVLQGSSHDGTPRFFCPPPFGNMGMPYSATNVPYHAAAQTFANRSASSTVVDGESDLQRTPSLPAADSVGLSSREEKQAASPRHSNATAARNSSSKKGRANDDCTVPIYTAPKTSAALPKVYSETSDWYSRGGWQPGMDLSKAYQSMPVSYDYQVDSSGPSSKRNECRDDSHTGVTRDYRGVDVSAKIVYSERGVAQQIDPSGESVKEKVSQMRGRYSQHMDFQEHGADQGEQLKRRKSKQYFDDPSEGEGLRSCATGNGECLTVVEEEEEDFGSKHRKSSSKPAKDGEVTDSPQSVQGLEKRHKRVESEIEKPGKQQTPSAESGSDVAGSSDENVENPGDGEVSEHSQPALWSDSEESDATMVEAGSSHKITPKDLISAVGQQGFWTARKLLQRQQMIFSSQVFELHRLVKVQQMLAAPDLEIDEVEQIASPPPLVESSPEKSQTKKPAPEKHGNGHHHDGDDHEKQKRPTAGHKPDSTCQSSTSKRVCVQASGSDPKFVRDNAAASAAPTLHNNNNNNNNNSNSNNNNNNNAGAQGGGAWGCPPVVKPGANGWYGGMPAFNGSYMYQPYPGSYPQAGVPSMGAFPGSYRPVICSSTPMDVPTMSSYSMPGYETLQDMYRYNTMQQQWQAAMYCNSMVQDPAASWYSAPPMPYMDPANQRMSSRWYDEMASSHPSSSGFHRSTQQSSSPLISSSSQVMLYPMHHPQWSDPSQGRDADRFRPQTSWPKSGGSCQSSDQGFRRLVVTSAPQESVASGPQAAAEGGWAKSWRQGFEGKCPQDSDARAAEVPAAPQETAVDAPESRTHKRNRENASEGRSHQNAEQRDRQKSSAAAAAEEASVRRDALPLFPLVPVSSDGEKSKSSTQSFPGVIKVVPRAMVATAESAAEILLSIQKQRQQ
ncbi:hypothetical protein R1flu_018207 [Riccia fluitans]|uniref:Early flowering 3 n=1 Tax=Riccia fluitans TaxID=41844 RepID=A0ABD1ZIL7_9MARC